MFTWLSHFFTGYVRISVTGSDKNRFVNIAIKNKISFWNYEKKENEYLLSIRIRDYRKLRNLRKRYNICVKLKKKNGLPFFTKKYFKRTGLLIGIVCSIFIYIYLSSCYWVINVEGDGIYSKDYIVEVAKECGIYEGCDKKEVEERDIMTKMMLALPEISWVTVNTNSSIVDIIVEYSVEIPEMQDDEGVGNIVASKIGIVKSIVAESGIPNVSIGEAVIPGEVLISGTWNSNRDKNEWELEEEPMEFSTQAQGVVIAETYNLFTTKVEKIQVVYEEISTYNKYAFNIFGIKIPITFSLVPTGEYYYESNSQYAYLLGTKLPISYQKESLIKLNSYEINLSEEDAIEQIEENLEKEMTNIENGMSIISTGEIVISEDENYYYGSIDCVCLENIAISEKIVIN